MKVLLIRVMADPLIGVHPRESSPPIILLYSVTLLKKSGFDAKIFDFDWRGLEKMPVPELEPSDFFLIEANSVAFGAARYLASFIKENFKKPVALYSMSPQDEVLDFLNSSFDFDYFVSGDPEKPVLNLAKYIAGKGELSEHIWAREKGGFNKLKPYIEKDLDSLPFPEQSLLPNLKYFKSKFGQPKKRGPWRFLLSSRGCPHSCLFCASAHRSSFGTLFRAHTTEYILNLMAYYKERFGIGAVSFEDDTFTFERDRVLALCEGMEKRGLVFPWVAQTRVDLLDKHLLKSMKSSGCFGIALGITALDNELLTFIDKGFTGEKAVESLNLCYEAGISVHINLIVGLPSQSQQQFIRDVKRLIKIARRAGLQIHKFDQRGCYHKEDWLNKPRMTIEEAGKLQAWAYLKFYFKPRNMLFQLLSRGRSLLLDSSERRLFFDFLKYYLIPLKRNFKN